MQRLVHPAERLEKKIHFQSNACCTVMQFSLGQEEKETQLYQFPLWSKLANRNIR